MTKRMREIQAEISAKTAEANEALAVKDLAKAEAALNAVDDLQKEYSLEERAENVGKSTAQTVAKPVATANSIKAFAAAARAGFKGMSEGSDPDGGYTVPEDIQTQINEYRDAERSLRDLVSVQRVRSNAGSRTFKKRAQQTGFSLVGEGAQIGTKATPKFELLQYEIHKYGGIFPVTNEVLADSDADLVALLSRWAGAESRATANRLILAAIATKAKTTLTGLNDIKKALNVTLGQAFKNTSTIVTNDDGLQYLDTLVDSNGRYLLQPSPTDPMRQTLSAGASVIPIEVMPNAIMPSEDVYEKTTDTALVAGKTYYTRSGSGTAESPYIYTVVSSPVVGSIGSYYEKHTGVPVVIGDLREGIAFFDRQMMTLKRSDEATIAGSDGSTLSAFECDLTLIRAIEREDVRVRDAQAFVNGQIVVRA